MSISVQNSGLSGGGTSPFFTNWLLVDKIWQVNQKLGVFSSLSHSLSLDYKWRAFQAATNSSSTRFSAVIWQFCSCFPMSPHPKILFEKPGYLLSYLTVWLACLESATVAVSERGRERTDWNHLSEESASSVKILFLLRAILTFNLVSGWRLAVAVFNTCCGILSTQFYEKVLC